MLQDEKQRLNTLVQFETEKRNQGYQQIAGVDEAGRGPLAGPVVAAACIIPEGLFFEGINDSKQLTDAQRRKLFDQIVKAEGVKFGVAIVTAFVIDTINILQATIKAMLDAVAQIEPDYLLVDGLQLPHPNLPSLKIIKGDARSQSIAAASVLAKVTRDNLMLDYHKQWPDYGFESHKGYGTKRHIQALTALGPCEIHRMSFEPIKSMNTKSTLNLTQLVY